MPCYMDQLVIWDQVMDPGNADMIRSLCSLEVDDFMNEPSLVRLGTAHQQRECLAH